MDFVVMQDIKTKQQQISEHKSEIMQKSRTITTIYSRLINIKQYEREEEGENKQRLYECIDSNRHERTIPKKGWTDFRPVRLKKRRR